MKQIILGTAGHIDHGKTSLIKAVTGINTDRLKEEQLRGITIELGFASLLLPSGQYLGIIDVPGHEKFVKNMVAGATGIDLVAMVIAADEGIMPQTREHMEICSLLGIQHGLVVLSKVDLVDEEWLELVKEEIETFTSGTFLESAPVISFSALSGQGAQEFIDILDQISSAIPARQSSGLFRLPVDRVFSMKGFGTVITGTLISGKVDVGDRVVVYPSGPTSKVRGLQVHNQSVSTAVAGMRTAINFQGLEKAAVNRGDVVAAPGTLVPSYMVDVTLSYLSSNHKALKSRQRVRFHSGTSEIMGIVVLLDRDELAPGQKTFAQIRLETPVNLIKGDHYVLRSYSPVRTIGGGQIIDPIPVKHKSARPEVISLLKTLAEGPDEQIVHRQIESAGYAGLSFRDLMLMVSLTEKQLEQILQKLMSAQTIVQIDKEKRIFVHHGSIENLQQAIHRQLENHHLKFPLKAGMPKEEVKSKLPASVDIKLFTLVLQHMIKNGRVAQQEDLIHLTSHRVSLGVDQQTVRRQLLEIYLQGGLMPPYFKEAGQQVKAPEDQTRQVMSLLVDEGLLVKVKEDLYYHRDHLQELKTKLVDYLSTNEDISTPQFKDMTGASRKFVIPLIEYFDSIQLTIRIGDIRKLRRKPVSAE